MIHAIDGDCIRYNPVVTVTLQRIAEASRVILKAILFRSLDTEAGRAM
jgi:hypothetical protein